MSLEFNAKILSISNVDGNLKIFRVAPQQGNIVEFRPGQFAVLALPNQNGEWIKRAYSIASSSKQNEYLEFYVALVSKGGFTPLLFALNENSPIYLAPKISGLFTLNDVPPDQHIVLISTGTGLAPYMSMLRSTFVCNSRQRIAIIHGARQSTELGYKNELESFAQLCKNFAYIPIISRPQNEVTPWNGHTGHVQDIWKNGILEKTWGFKLTPNNCHFFLCGNPAMIEANKEMLLKEGYLNHSKHSPGNIHIESFW